MKVCVGSIILILFSSLSIQTTCFQQTLTQLSKFTTIGNKRVTLGPLHLGFDDIIDNDADILEQLRHQLQISTQKQLRERPSGSSNPREISNHIKAFFISKKRGIEETSEFKQYLTDCKDSLDIINIITIFDGASRLSIPIKDIIEWNSVEDALGKFNFMISSTLVNKAFSGSFSLSLLSLISFSSLSFSSLSQHLET